MFPEIWFFYDPAEDGGWEVLELGEEFDTPLMFAFDSVKFADQCFPEISETATGHYRISARILERYKTELLLDFGLKTNASMFGDTPVEGLASQNNLVGVGSFLASPLWRPQWPRSLTDRCTYRLKVVEIRKLKNANGWDQRDSSGAEIVASMKNFYDGWFLLRCRPISGPKT